MVIVLILQGIQGSETGGEAVFQVEGLRTDDAKLPAAADLHQGTTTVVTRGQRLILRFSRP